MRKSVIAAGVVFVAGIVLAMMANSTDRKDAIRYNRNEPTPDLVKHERVTVISPVLMERINAIMRNVI